MHLIKLAAIDIGSNAVRLLLTNVVEDQHGVSFRKSQLVRVPIRLGVDAFGQGKIGEQRANKLVTTLSAYKLLMDVEEVAAYKACATSAMREASNAKKLIERIKNQTGIEVEIIDGRREAQIIYSNGIAEHLDQHTPFLYVDVGGGSTEITYFIDSQLVDSASFNIGTIRILTQNTTKPQLAAMKQWLQQLQFAGRTPRIIGSGGNINKMYKMLRKPEGKSITYNELHALNRFISTFSLDDRIRVLGLNPDRADVIIPASNIFLKVMKWTEAKDVIVPTIGISDGIVRMLYKEQIKKTKP